jgi:hypothetical protein
MLTEEARADLRAEPLRSP